MPESIDSGRLSNPSIVGGLLRIWWMLGGAAALAIIAAIVATESAGRPSLRDAAFVAVVLSMIVARYFDIRRFDGATGDGLPATMEHFRKYSIKLLAVSALMLGVAHVLAWL